MAHYSIQTVPHNLSKEETIIQMVETLDHLKAITQDIFSRVNKRLDKNTEKLSSISKRIDVAASKVQLLKADTKAKTVFSSSKYPAADINKDYVSIFSDSPHIERQRHEINYKKYITTYEPLSKLQFFHVKTLNQKESSIPEGLGDIPHDIKCINDLLLFNTGRNIYKDFKPGDSHKDSEHINSNNDYYTTSELGPAPFSINQRSSMQHANKDNYFYTPKVEELPDLDVPWDLPDLPGIADDVRYEIDIGTIITPSVVNTTSPNVELDLPDLVEVKADIETLTAVSAVPPPPPIEDIPILPPVHQAVEAPPQVKEHIQESKKPPSPPPVAILPTNDSHASLMDAIRKAGGSQKANLRKILEKPEVAKGSRKLAPTGDLMADLHSKLMMRRKGISGIKNPDQGGSTADSTFARLSSIIPPPTKSSDAGSGVSTDEDAWNDDD
ncbi:WASH complex subunit 1 [Euwallacea similis]|uniref:WASH complex subunit 1 n=1 Tax=Euwallacea similis TaxID=1736056 RepID=UPI00344C38A8